MELENEKKQEEKSAEQSAGSREGYQAAGQSGDYPKFRAPGRSPRPRIHTQRPYNQERGGYSSKNSNDEGGFRPEGFGAGLQSSPARQQYRPRYGNNDNNKGYRPRYNAGAAQGEEGYQQRPSYGNRGGYQQGGGYNNRQGGYQQRGNYGGGNRQGGYQQRGNYGGNRPGGYQQNYNNEGEGYGNYRQGGYQQRGGYNAGGRQGYGNNRQGGYQQRGGYNNRQGGFRPQGGGFAPNPKAGFKKRIDYKDDSIDPNEPMRLNKYLANAGVCSRREADEFIQAGVVTVNGAVVTELGTKVLRSDEVKFHDQPVSLEKKVYVLLNKPKDYVTTSDDPQQRKTVMDLVKNACPERIYPVGRLDRNTTGVLLLTNDGDMASKLTHPKFLKKKIYHVHLDKNVTAHDLQQIRDGITLEDGEIKADDVQYADPVDKKQVGIEIHSGKNRIVRRIFEKLGYRVTKLDRVQFAGLTKKGLRRGDWRYLTEEEVVRLRMGSYE